MTSSRTSCPPPLYRVAVTDTRVSSSSVSSAAAVSTSPPSAKKSAPLLAPVPKTVATSRPVTNRMMSKSWMPQSRNRPPLVGMYAAGGGDWSCVLARIVCTKPSSPDRTASRARR